MIEGVCIGFMVDVSDSLTCITNNVPYKLWATHGLQKIVALVMNISHGREIMEMMSE